MSAVAAAPLVAVGSNSTEHFAAILGSYRDRLPLAVDFEPGLGKEHASARGFRHLEGDLVILTDDDVLQEPDGIEQFLALAAQPEFSRAWRRQNTVERG